MDAEGVELGVGPDGVRMTTMLGMEMDHRIPEGWSPHIGWGSSQVIPRGFFPHSKEVSLHSHPLHSHLKRDEEAVDCLRVERESRHEPMVLVRTSSTGQQTTARGKCYSVHVAIMLQCCYFRHVWQ